MKSENIVMLIAIFFSLALNKSCTQPSKLEPIWQDFRPMRVGNFLRVARLC